LAPATKNADEYRQHLVDTSVDAARTSAYATDAPDLTYVEILRATQWWVLYGSAGFAVLCIVIGAVEGLFGR